MEINLTFSTRNNWISIFDQTASKKAKQYKMPNSNNNNNNNNYYNNNNNDHSSSRKIQNKTKRQMVALEQEKLSKVCCEQTFTTVISLQLHLVNFRTIANVGHSSYCILCLKVVKRLKEHYIVIKKTTTTTIHQQCLFSHEIS